MDWPSKYEPPDPILMDMKPDSTRPFARSAMARSRRARFAILMATAMAVGACGTAVESTASAPEAAVSTGAGASGAGGHEYGASLDEFLDGEVDRPTGSTPSDRFTEIEWADLIPPGFSGAEISARFDKRIAAVTPGSPEADEIYAELQAEYSNPPINPELAGDEIQLAGFVAPLTYQEDLVTEFLLVPYFGACIHVPPPPVNQTVMVTLEDGQGLSIDEAGGAVWVTGTLAIEGAETDLATAGYSITSAQTGVYDGV